MYMINLTGFDFIKKTQTHVESTIKNILGLRQSVHCTCRLVVGDLQLPLDNHSFLRTNRWCGVSCFTTS